MTSEPPDNAPPAAPPTEQGPIPADRKQDGALDGYHAAAETVGFIPSLRWKDNLFQAVFIIGATGAAAIIGLVFHPLSGVLGSGAPASASAAILGIAALIGSFFLSGLVLMVLGWIRTAKRRKA